MPYILGYCQGNYTATNFPDLFEVIPLSITSRNYSSVYFQFPINGRTAIKDACYIFNISILIKLKVHMRWKHTHTRTESYEREQLTRDTHHSSFKSNENLSSFFFFTKTKENKIRRQAIFILKYFCIAQNECKKFNLIEKYNVMR